MADSTDTAPAPPTNGQKVRLLTAPPPRPMTAAPPRPVAPKVQAAEPAVEKPVEKPAVKVADKSADRYGVHVCPFCGAKRADPADACPKCTMRDTPATRAATAERLGPWYVLQSRSPSAPGMKLATLRTLIGKGHVTRRSVLRGPTTGQFWTFAERARGVAREFGSCFSCGADVKPAADRCPRCGQDQRPPADPDQLLAAATGAAVVNGRKKAEQVAAARAADSAKPAPARVTAAVGPGGEGIFSAKELAAAFRLNHDPSVDPDDPTAAAPPPRKRRWGLFLLLALVVLAAGVAGLYYYPPTHDEVVRVFAQVRAWIVEHVPPVEI